MSFASPILLACLVVPVLALAVYLRLERKPPPQAVSYSNLAVLASVATGPRWRRHVLAGLLLGALTLLCIAVARPRVPLSTTSDRASVVLVVDVSVSMNAMDVAPSRLEAARSAITAFVDRVPRRLRVGLVAFAEEPQVLSDPTTDHDALKRAIAALSPGYGTAIGDGLARGVQLVRASTGEVAKKPAGARPQGAVVLLSDGSQTRGVLQPAEGAELARQAGIPVYTIALGTLSGTVTLLRSDGYVTVPVPPDRETLARIAQTTGGSTFAATDADGLGSVYRRLGSVVARTTKPQEVTSAFVAVAAALLAVGIAVSGLTGPRLP